MSSNLPPGVTQKMIDDYFAGPCEECLNGDHDECTDSECRCDECEEAARDDYYESRAEERRLERRYGHDDD
jgi:hypothetical protein